MRMVKGKNQRHLTINNLELRTIQGNDGQAEQPVIHGYAAVYNSESELLYGVFREVIRPGAFDSSLNNDVRALWNHDSAYVLGRTTSGTLNIRSDAKGLYFEVSPPDTQWANDLCTSIQRGDINQMSFGFVVNEDNWEMLEDGTEMRELLNVDLQEVSVVTFPAYQATSAGMRSLDQEDEEVKKHLEKRNKEKSPSAPEKRFFDYLKLLKTWDSRAMMMDPDGDPDYDSSEDEQAKKKKRSTKDEGKDDADGGFPEDPGSEADDPNNNDTLDDDEGDEDESQEDKKK